MPRHFLRLADLSPQELIETLDLAEDLKKMRGRSDPPKPLVGKSVAVLLEKSSTRTRISFVVGIYELGGFPMVLPSRDLQLDRGEAIEDTARMLSRYVHAVVYRTSGHDRIRRLANSSTIPVINGLCDTYHPCQVVADLMTVRESIAKPLKDVRVAWIGDGNNVANSWIEAALLTGLHLRLACPSGYEPSEELIHFAAKSAPDTIHVVRDPREAVREADVVTTDVWASMGQETERDKRMQAFANFTVTPALMKEAAPSAIFLHCLPAHRGEEVESAVIDGPQSRVLDEAENRLHAQKAILSHLMA